MDDPLVVFAFANLAIFVNFSHPFIRLSMSCPSCSDHVLRKVTSAKSNFSFSHASRVAGLSTTNVARTKLAVMG